MQVTETLSEGLKREYDISLPASDLAAKLNGQLADMRAKVRINGFRPARCRSSICGRFTASR